MFIENAMILTKEYGQYNTKSNSTINVDLFSPGSLSISWDIYHPFINRK